MKEVCEVRNGIAAVKAVIAILYKNMLMAKTNDRKDRRALYFYLENLMRKSVFVWKHKLKARKHRKIHQEERRATKKLCFSVLKQYAAYSRKRKMIVFVMFKVAKKFDMFRAFDRWRESKMSWMDSILSKEQRLRKELECKLDQLKINLTSY